MFVEGGAMNTPYAVRLKRRALTSAISAIVASSAAPDAAAQGTSEAEGGRVLEEVIVTARKRTERIQDLPQAVLAFDSGDIAKIGIRNMTDLARFVPALTVVGEGGLTNKIVYRGLADSVSPFIVESSAAIYLDEQPLTTGSKSPEIFPVDLERIESLAGPQGTLFGASSQSGTLRYIVAKPDPGAFDANIQAGTHQVSHGDLGWDVDAMVNVPLIEDRLAIRLVGFSAEDAGYIDNVQGVTPYGGSKSNAGVTGEDINDTEWHGGRISAKWLLTDKWSVTGIYNNQNLKTHGFNDFDRSVGEYKTVKFVEELRDDSWYNGQLTIEGELGSTKLTSSTSYFERDTAYVFDASVSMAQYHAAYGVYGRDTCGSDAYVKYAYASYNLYDFATACELNGFGFDVDDGDPIAWYRHDQKNTRWTHETRLSGSNSRLDWTLGFFYQEADEHWEAGTYIQDYTRTESWAQYQAQQENLGNPPLEPTDIRWQNGEQSTRKDTAVFGEGTFSLNEHWKLLAGARWYDSSVERDYFDRVPSTHPIPTLVVGDSDEDGWLPKIGFQYVIDDERMLYALYSEGFRLGGVNRDRAEQRGLVPTFPREYDSDILQNYEAGLKSRWLDGHLQLNVTLYHQIWKDAQLELLDPQNFTSIDTDGDGEGDTTYPFQIVVANLGDSIVDGVDLEVSALFGAGFSAGLVSTYLFKAETDEDVIVENPNDPTDEPYRLDGGTRLPLTADLKLATYLEYGWQIGGGDAFARLQYSYTGESWNQIADGDGFENSDEYGARVRDPAYSTVDLRTGFMTGDWEFSVYVDNMLDERVESYRSFGPDVYFDRGESVFTARPRTFGVSVRKRFRPD
jgi:outer membrane receptor protein involved in Fe transport